VLEFARRGYDELDVFNDLDPKIGLALGVIDIKDNEVEAPDLVATADRARSSKTIGTSASAT
jgi:methionine synthase II (cobalamin-independent)